jgi:hypothetical protein
MEAIVHIKNTDYLAAKKIYKNRENIHSNLNCTKITQHIFIELMDKVTIHVEKNGEARQESEKRRSDHISKIHVDNNQKEKNAGFTICGLG